jgi:ribosomal-protein-alanine N-acetyltransferase
MDALIARSAELGASAVLLEVRVDNERAQGLYLRHGYSVIHTRRGYYNDGCDALIMNKSLLADTEPERNEGESA